MSPGDCQLLFNVCDPVVCPNSRCDFGGTYPVDNVIQSGIVGSTLLCLPNSIFLHPNTGVVIPVCLTGIHAGIDALTQVLENYRDCLNESATTGKVVGVCDMIYSVYMCDFFWRQVGPFSENLIKDIFLKVFGAGDKGGGEYLFVQDAWTNAEKSAQFMQSTYGSNSKLAFGFKDLTQTAVSEVCKAPFSATYPDKFDTMLEPESPVQFYASFSEIPYTDASVPPTSQYSVSYFIYSGNDQGHYYQIYLKSGPTALGYVGKDSAVVASGYVNQGEKVSFKKDLLEVSGFKELCVKIDVQEKCGFKSVSTSMALNYAKDYTTGSQAGSNISTESECIAGSASAGSLLTPNLQSAAEGLANPAIYNQGIIRVCSSGNPGAGTPDQSRWNYVGYCDDRTIGCWIDTKSVENAITGRGLENETLSAIAALNLDYLTSQGGYFTKEVGRAKINDLKVVYNNLLTQIKQDPASVENAIYSGTLIDFGNTSYNGRKFVGFSDDIKSLSAKLIYNDQKAELAIYQAYVYDQIARKIGKNVTLGSVSSSSSSGTSTNSANASANANNSVASVGGISSQDKVDIANEQGFWTTVSDKILSDDVLSLACALSPNPADSIVSGTGRATGAGAIAVTSQAAANVAEVTSLSPVMVQSGNYVIQSGVAQRLAIFNSGGISYVKDLTGNIIGQVGTGGKIISPSGKVIKGLSLAANAKYVDAAGNVITQTGSLVANGKGALKLVTPTSKAFTAISRISNALLLYELACKCLQTEQAFFSAWDSTQEFQLASAETDSQVTTRIINFNKQINLINQSMDDLEYYIKQIEDVSLQDKLISEYDSLKQQFDTIVNLNRKLRDTYNVYRTNDEKKSSRFFTLVAGSEFSDSEYSYLKDLMKALRVRLVDAGKLVESMNTKINDVTSSVSVSSSAGVSSGTIFVPDSFKNQVSSSNLVSSKGSYSISESVIPADRTMINAVTSGGLVNIPDTSKLAKRHFNLTFILDNSYDYNSIDSVVKNFLINKYGQFWKSDSNLQIFAKKIVLDSNYNKWDVYVTYYGNTDFLQNDAFDQLMQAGEQMIAQVNLFLGDAQTTLNSCTNTLSGYTSKVSCPVYNSAKVDVDIQEIKNILILAEKATTSSDQLKYANDALSKTQILKTYLVSNGAESSLVSQIDGIIVSLQQEIVKIQ
jgi:hypothetical protein